MRPKNVEVEKAGGQRPREAQQRVPQAGEIWWLSLDPTKGHEQAGFRPVVVLSPAGMNGPTRRIIGVPVTTSLATPGTARARMQVPLQGLPRACAALPDQVTTLDWTARIAEFRSEQASEHELMEIRVRVKAVCGID